jgi:hypothetical protein
MSDNISNNLPNSLIKSKNILNNNVKIGKTNIVKNLSQDSLYNENNKKN